MGSPDTSPAPTAAVVTVSYNSESVLVGLLASVPTATRAGVGSGGTVVVIADNIPGGSETVRQIAAETGADYLPQPTNGGYGRAMNAAVRSLPASVTSVLITNPDVVLHAGALDILERVLDEDPTIAAVGPAIETDGVIYPSARAVPSLRVGIGHALFANVWLDNPWSRAYRNASDLPLRRRDAGWLSGACLLVRRSAFEQLGGFDEGFFMYFEDVDLGYRFGKAGYRNVYEPSALVTHSGAHSTSGESRAMIEAHHVSARRFLNKKYSAWYLWPLRVALSLGLRLRSRYTRV